MAKQIDDRTISGWFNVCRKFVPDVDRYACNIRYWVVWQQGSSSLKKVNGPTDPTPHECRTEPLPANFWDQHTPFTEESSG